MGDLQTPAGPCNALIITRNEQVSGSIPLMGPPFIAASLLSSLVRAATQVASPAERSGLPLYQFLLGSLAYRHPLKAHVLRVST